MFKQVRDKMQSHFNVMKTSRLFQVDFDKDKIWEVYLGGFPEKFRQGNNCNCCKSFLRQWGGVVVINEDYSVTSLWDFEPDDEEYNDAIRALREYIHSLPISGIFVNTSPKCGTDKTPDSVRGIVWNHWYMELPGSAVKRDVGPATGEARANHDVLKRSVEEINQSAVDTVLELTAQNSLYRGAEFKPLVDGLNSVKQKSRKVKAKNKPAFYWLESTRASQAVCRINNSAIGTLLSDLSEGKDLDKAVTSFEKVVAPSNYKRPVAIATPKMIENAKARLQELGLIDALNRRVLSDSDLTVANSLFVNRAKGTATLDVFDSLKKDVTVNPKTLSKVEEVSIEDFIKKVLPTAKSVRVLVENSHLGNFATLVGPVNETAPLFKWDNNYSWHYTGSVADSIKEKVKNAGGKVDGVLRISLSWHNHDDLDLHLHEPGGYKVYYPNKGQTSPSGAVLDIDANMSTSNMSREPVENIYWLNPPKKEGNYKVVVNNFNKRETKDTGFDVEVEYDGEITNFSFRDNGASGANFTVVDFTYSRKDGIKFSKEGSTGNYASKEKWGIKTGQFHRVKSITLSPNHWNTGVGNKHYFFFLDGCQTEENTRGLYNEFLRQDLDGDRKVFELLGNKITVEGSPSELSGLGFSETLRNHLFVEVEGNFLRVIKVKI